MPPGNAKSRVAQSKQRFCGQFSSGAVPDENAMQKFIALKEYLIMEMARVRVRKTMTIA
jgi:hypothetical protein